LLSFDSSDGCVKLTDVAVDLITRGLPNLQLLGLSNCTLITDKVTVFANHDCS
jgi:hypothetical protein